MTTLGNHENYGGPGVVGEGLRTDGRIGAHSIHFYDVGIGGDGLRGPSVGFDNPYRKFLAHADSPEVWKDETLISGGKHYGHLEVDVQPETNGDWTITVTPVHAFPLIDVTGQVTAWERRCCDDVVRITQSAR